MKLECIKENLENAIHKAERFAARNSTLPVLQCILFSVKNSTLTLRATNLEVGIEVVLPVKSKDEGMIAVPAHIFSQLLSTLPKEGSVLLESTDTTLLVKTKNSSASVKLLSPDDFPTIPLIRGEQLVTLPVKVLTEGLRSVWYCASLSSIRPELSSVYISYQDGSLVFVATDSFRLAEKKISVPKVKQFDPFLLPYKNIPEIIKIFDGEESDMEISFTKNQISFYLASLTITSRCVDAIFPDYKQIIPKTVSTECILLKNDLIQTLRATTLFSDKFNHVHFNVDTKEKRFILSSKNSEVGEVEYTAPATLSGESIEINFNHKYISDSFQSLFSDSIQLQLSGLTKPMVLRGVGDDSFMYLAMPMNK